MMLYLAYISIFFLMMQLMNSLLNVLFRQKIPSAKEHEKRLISILIPARNEEDNIKVLLEDLQRFDDKHIEVLIYNDLSSDNTAQVVKDYAQRDSRISLLKTEKLPQGWLGKNHGCAQLAQAAKGDYFLFLDADVSMDFTLVRDVVPYGRKHGLGLLSIFPIQEQKTLGEKLTVPIMNYILLTLLPLIFVRVSPFKSHAAANGQFMLFDAKTYHNYQPHSVFRNSVVEDIVIARYLKKMGVKIACLTGEARVRCRMYKSYKEAYLGFSKNLFMFFGNQVSVALVFWLFASLGLIPVLVAMPSYTLIYLLGLLLILGLYSAQSKQSIIINTILYPAHLFFMLGVMMNGLLIKMRKKHVWKGRDIYS